MVKSRSCAKCGKIMENPSRNCCATCLRVLNALLKFCDVKEQSKQTGGGARKPREEGRDRKHPQNKRPAPASAALSKSTPNVSSKENRVPDYKELYAISNSQPLTDLPSAKQGKFVKHSAQVEKAKSKFLEYRSPQVGPIVKTPKSLVSSITAVNHNNNEVHPDGVDGHFIQRHDAYVNYHRGQPPKGEAHGHQQHQNQQQQGDEVSRTSSITNLNEQKAQKGGALAKTKKTASKDRLDKLQEKRNDPKKGVTKSHKPDDEQLSVEASEVESLQKQLLDMATEKTALSLQLGEQKSQMHALHSEIVDLKKVHEKLNEENNLLRNRLKDVAHSPLSDSEKQQLLLESHRHHNSAPASIATNLLEDGTPTDVTACPTPDWDKQSSGNVSEISVACLQDKINQMQETHYSTNEELQATLQELTELQRQLTELQQDNEQLIEEKNLMFDSLCRQTERLNESKSELENLKQALTREKEDVQYDAAQAEHEQKLVDLLKDVQEEREILLLKQEQLGNELEDAKAEIIGNAAVIEQLGERVKTLECALDAKHAEHKQLEQELAAAKDQSSGRQIEVNRLTDLLENARTKINELEQDRALSDKSELDEILDNARKEKDSLESEVTHLKELLARNRNETEKLKDQVSILQEECKVTRNNAKCTQSELEYKCEKLQSEKTALNEQLVQLQDAANGLQLQAQCQLEDKRQLSAVLSETQKLLSEAERKSAEVEAELTEVKRLRKEENEEWERFQNDLLTSVRVANDFKTEAQQDLQKTILENKAHREKVKQLEATIDKLRGQSVTNSSPTVDEVAPAVTLREDPRPSRTSSEEPGEGRGSSEEAKHRRRSPEEPKRREDDAKAKSSPPRHFIKKPKIFRNTRGYNVSPSSQEGEFVEVPVDVPKDATVDLKKKGFNLVAKRKKEEDTVKTHLTLQEQKNLRALTQLYEAIDPAVPEEDLSAEQKFIVKLKRTYDSSFERTKRKPVANKSKSGLAISRPLLASVFDNPKLKQIADDPTVRIVEDETQRQLYGVPGVFYPANEPKFEDICRSNIEFRYYDEVEDNQTTLKSFKPTDSFLKSRSMTDLHVQRADFVKMSNFEMKRQLSDSSLVNFVSPKNDYYDDDSFSDTSSENLDVKPENPEQLGETLEELYKKINPKLPEDQLSNEQVFVKKMKESMDEYGRKESLRKEKKRNIKISSPTKQSVWNNEKLASIIKDPNLKTIEPEKKPSVFVKIKSKVAKNELSNYYFYDHEKNPMETPDNSVVGLPDNRFSSESDATFLAKHKIQKIGSIPPTETFNAYVKQKLATPEDEEEKIFPRTKSIEIQTDENLLTKGIDVRKSLQNLRSTPPELPGFLSELKTTTHEEEEHHVPDFHLEAKEEKVSNLKNSLKRKAEMEIMYQLMKPTSPKEIHVPKRNFSFYSEDEDPRTTSYEEITDFIAEDTEIKITTESSPVKIIEELKKEDRPKNLVAPMVVRPSTSSDEGFFTKAKIESINFLNQERNISSLIYEENLISEDGDFFRKAKVESERFLEEERNFSMIWKPIGRKTEVIQDHKFDFVDFFLEQERKFSMIWNKYEERVPSEESNEIDKENVDSKKELTKDEIIQELKKNICQLNQYLFASNEEGFVKPHQEIFKQEEKSKEGITYFPMNLRGKENSENEEVITSNKNESDTKKNSFERPEELILGNMRLFEGAKEITTKSGGILKKRREEKLIKIEENPIEIGEAPTKIKEAKIKIKQPPLKIEEDLIKIEEVPIKIEAPMKIEDGPIKLKKAPIKIKEAPIEIEEALIKVKEAPIQIEENAILIEEIPIKIEKAPIKIKEKLIEIEKSLIGIEENLIRVEDRSVEAEESPIEQRQIKIEESPINIEENRAQIQEKSVEVDENSIKIGEKSTKIEEKPIAIEEKPVTFRKRPFGIERRPIGIIKSPVEFEKRPVEFEERSVEFGRNSVAIGERLVDKEEESAEIKGKPLNIEGELMKIEKLDLVEIEETPDTSEERPKTEGKSVEVQDKLIDIERKSLDIEDNPVHSEGKLVDIEDKPLDFEDNSVEIEGKLVDIEGKPVGFEGKLIDIEEKLVEIEGTVFHIEEKPINIEENRIDIEEKLFDIEEKPVGIEGKLVQIETNSVEIEEKQAKIGLGWLDQPNPVGFEENRIRIEEKLIDVEERRVEIVGKLVGIEEKRFEIEEKPAKIQETPIEIEGRLVDIEEKQFGIEGKLVQIEEKPVGSLDGIQIEEKSVDIEDKPVEIEGKLVEIEENPIDIEGQLADIKENQFKIEENPAKIEENPVKTEEKQADIEKTPAKIEVKLLNIEENPAKIEANPVKIEENPVEIERSSMEIVEKPVENERRSINISIPSERNARIVKEETGRSVETFLNEERAATDKEGSKSEDIETFLSSISVPLRRKGKPKKEDVGRKVEEYEKRASRNEEDTRKSLILSESEERKDRKSTEIKERPFGIKEKLVEIKEKPVEIKEKPGEIQETPIEAQRTSIEINRKLVDIEGRSVELEGRPPVDMEGRSVDIEETRVDIEERAAEIEGRTAELQERPAEIEGIPIENQRKSIEFEGRPAEIEGKPVEIKGRTIENQQKSIEFEGGTVGIENRPVGIEESSTLIDYNSLKGEENKFYEEAKISCIKFLDEERQTSKIWKNVEPQDDISLYGLNINFSFQDGIARSSSNLPEGDTEEVPKIYNNDLNPIKIEDDQNEEVAFRKKTGESTPSRNSSSAHFKRKSRQFRKPTGIGLDQQISLLLSNDEEDEERFEETECATPTNSPVEEGDGITRNPSMRSTSSNEDEIMKNLSSKLDEDEIVLVRTLRRKYNKERPGSGINEEDLKLIEKAKMQCLSPEFSEETVFFTAKNEEYFPGVKGEETEENSELTEEEMRLIESIKRRSFGSDNEKEESEESEIRDEENEIGKKGKDKKKEVRRNIEGFLDEEIVATNTKFKVQIEQDMEIFIDNTSARLRQKSKDKEEIGKEGKDKKEEVRRNVEGFLDEEIVATNVKSKVQIEEGTEIFIDNTSARLRQKSKDKEEIGKEGKDKKEEVRRNVEGFLNEEIVATNAKSKVQIEEGTEIFIDNTSARLRQKSKDKEEIGKKGKDKKEEVRRNVEGFLDGEIVATNAKTEVQVEEGTEIFIDNTSARLRQKSTDKEEIGKKDNDKKEEVGRKVEEFLDEEMMVTNIWVASRRKSEDRKEEVGRRVEESPMFFKGEEEKSVETKIEPVEIQESSIEDKENPVDTQERSLNDEGEPDEVQGKLLEDGRRRGGEILKTKYLELSSPKSFQRRSYDDRGAVWRDFAGNILEKKKPAKEATKERLSLRERYSSLSAALDTKGVYEPIYANFSGVFPAKNSGGKFGAKKDPVPQPRSTGLQSASPLPEMACHEVVKNNFMGKMSENADDEEAAKKLDVKRQEREEAAANPAEAEEEVARAEEKLEKLKGVKKKIIKGEEAASSSSNVNNTGEDANKKTITKSSSMEILYDSETSNNLSAASTDCMDQSYLNLFKSPEQVVYENLKETTGKEEKPGEVTLHYFKSGNVSSDESNNSNVPQPETLPNKVSFLRKKFEKKPESAKFELKVKVDTNSDDSTTLNPVRSVPKTPNLPKAVNTTTVGESGNSEVPQCSIAENASLENLRRNSRKSFENARSVFEPNAAERPSSAAKVRSSRVISSTVPEEPSEKPDVKKLAENADKEPKKPE